MLASPAKGRQDRGPQLFERSRVLAVIRYRVAGDLERVAAAIADAGAVPEITADTPGALEAVRALAREGAPVGAGTILDAETATAFADAGASFLVSPAAVPAVASVARARGIPSLLGALTPTEVAAALAAGADAVKLFPASLGGVAYLRALRGPFGSAAFVPTGGVVIDDVAAWLDAGAVAVGLGASLVGRDPPQDDLAFEALAERVGRAVALARRGATPPPICSRSGRRCCRWSPSACRSPMRPSSRSRSAGPSRTPASPPSAPERPPGG